MRRSTTAVLFGKRRSPARFVATVPAFVFLLFAAMGFDDGGVASALPYLVLSLLAASYVLRPMLLTWALVFGACAVYTAMVATSRNVPTSEWLIFLSFGAVPTLLLWFARPHGSKACEA